MTHPALEYAESLGVHSVYDEALSLEQRLDEALTALDKAQDERRSFDSRIEDREMDLLIDERGKHPDHSEAAFKRHMSEVYYKDADLKMMKLQRNMKAGECSGLELDIEYVKARLKTAQARMTELGGYFQYLAAVKTAESSALVRQEFQAFQAASAAVAQ